jgi:hypothetical protein
MSHCRSRIIRIASTPLIVADRRVNYPSCAAFVVVQKPPIGDSASVMPRTE